MRLMEGDKALLRSWGYSDFEIPHIEAATHSRNTIYHLDGLRVCRNCAIQIHGREEYLSRLSRSAFHATAERTMPDGAHTVSFDSYLLLTGKGEKLKCGKSK